MEKRCLLAALFLGHQRIKPEIIMITKIKVADATIGAGLAEKIDIPGQTAAKMTHDYLAELT
jgi:hypothetical protein